MRWSTSSIEARWHSASTGLAKSSTWWTVRTTAGTRPSARSASSERADRQSSAWWTSAGPAARSPSARASRVAQDARLDVLARPAVDGHQARRHARLAEEGGAVGRERPQLDVVAAVAERLGERERVDDAAPRLGRVGDEADPQASPASAAARRAAAALVGARRAPASARVASWRLRTWGSSSVPST